MYRQEKILGPLEICNYLEKSSDARSRSTLENSLQEVMLYTYTAEDPYSPVSTPLLHEFTKESYVGKKNKESSSSTGALPQRAVHRPQIMFICLASDVM